MNVWLSCFSTRSLLFYFPPSPASQRYDSNASASDSSDEGDDSEDDSAKKKKAKKVKVVKEKKERKQIGRAHV